MRILTPKLVIHVVFTFLQVGAAGQCRYDKIGLITQYL
jgi:hypothetical protein